MMNHHLQKILSYEPNLNWVEEAHNYIALLERGRLHKKNFKPGIDETATIHETAIISSCSYIGPRCYIGPYCKISAGSILTAGCKIGFSSDIYSAIILNNTIVAHSTCISHSVIGPNCNLAFGFVTATRHLFNKPIKVYLGKSTIYFSSERHHGTVFMHGVETGVHTSSMPGSTVMSNIRILPHESAKGYVSI